LELIIKNSGSGSYQVQPDEGKHESNLLKLDSTKAKKELGWKPKYNLNQAVTNTALWYKEFYSNKSRIKKFSLNQINSYFSN
jgi:CDP-glucose 4,6-dehydratase